MEKQRKLNKLKVGIVIFLVVFALTITVFGRYIYNSAREAYFTSKQFYFYSNIMTADGANYQYNNWGGVGVYAIEIELYSYVNSLSKLNYDLDYEVSCETEDSDKIKCTINSYDNTATSTATGTIFHSNNNTSLVTVYVTPLTQISKGDSVKLNVTAKTESPYQKEISCEFTLNIETHQENTYSIEDVANRDYAVLKLLNAEERTTEVTLEFDPNELRLDLNDECYINKKSVETTTINGNQYVSKIIFSMSAESAKNVKFYKVEKSEDYSYPGSDDVCAINVTI